MTKSTTQTAPPIPRPESFRQRDFRGRMGYPYPRKDTPMNIALAALALALGTFASLASFAQDEARQKLLQEIFDDLEKGIKMKEEAVFKGRWHAEGYEKNFCGGSGLSGKAVFGQGSRKKWFLKPEIAQAKTVENGTLIVVPCEVWAWEKGKSVDKVDLVLVREKEAYLVLGGGEKRDDVDGLVSRWLKKEPLEAPEKQD